MFFKFSGDEIRARLLTRRAEKYIGMLEDRMRWQKQIQGRWQVTEADGTKFDLHVTPFTTIAHVYSPDGIRGYDPISEDVREQWEELPIERPEIPTFMWVGGRILNARSINYYDHVDRKYKVDRDEYKDIPNSYGTDLGEQTAMIEEMYPILTSGTTWGMIEPEEVFRAYEEYVIQGKKGHTRGQPQILLPAEWYRTVDFLGWYLGHMFVKKQYTHVAWAYKAGPAVDVPEVEEPDNGAPPDPPPVLATEHGPVNIAVTEPGYDWYNSDGTDLTEGLYTGRFSNPNVEVLFAGPSRDRYNTETEETEYIGSRLILANRTKNGLYSITAPWCYDSDKHGKWHGFAMLDPNDGYKDFSAALLTGYPDTLNGVPLLVNYGPVTNSAVGILRTEAYVRWVTKAKRGNYNLGSLPMLTVGRDTLEHVFPGRVDFSSGHQCKGKVLSGLYAITASIAHRRRGFRMEEDDSGVPKSQYVPVLGPARVEIQIHTGSKSDPTVFKYISSVDSRYPGSSERSPNADGYWDDYAGGILGNLYSLDGGEPIATAPWDPVATNWVDTTFLVDLKRQLGVAESSEALTETKVAALISTLPAGTVLRPRL